MCQRGRSTGHEAACAGAIDAVLFALVLEYARTDEIESDVLLDRMEAIGPAASAAFAATLPACLSPLLTPKELLDVGMFYYAETKFDRMGFRLMKAAADRGDSEAMFVVAGSFATGVSVDRSLPNCIRYFDMAIETGHTLSMCYRAALFVNGSPDECMRGVALWRKAAAAGSVVAHHVMALTAEALGRTTGAILHHKNAAELAKLQGETVERILEKSFFSQLSPSIAFLIAHGDTAINAFFA